MNDLELNDQVHSHGDPKYIKIYVPAGPEVHRKLHGKYDNLRNRETEENRENLVQPAAKHRHKDQGLHYRLSNPQCKLDLGAGHSSIRSVS